MNNEKIEHELTEKIVCPHCGCIQLDSDPYGDSGEMECGKKFTWERFTYIDYLTQKLDKEE